MAKKKDLEELLASQLDELGIVYEREVMLIPGRRFRWDFIVPHGGIAIEVNGGTWLGNKGAHSSGKGIARDYEKANLATEYGWSVLLFSADMVKSGEAASQVARCLVEFVAEQSMAYQAVNYAISQGLEDCPTMAAKAKRLIRKSKRRRESAAARQRSF